MNFPFPWWGWSRPSRAPQRCAGAFWCLQRPARRRAGRCKHQNAAAIEAQFSGGAPVDLSAHLPCGEGFDGAVLGCTHYSLIKREIAHYLGTAVFDGAFGTARHALSLVNLGIDDHFKPPNIPNNCLSSKLNKNGQEGVFFLGSGQKHNRDLFDLNICFNFI